MERIRRFYDQYATSKSIDGAILYIVSMEAMAFLGILTMVGDFWNAATRPFDPVYFSVGVFLTLVGVLGTFHGALIIHAIVRHLEAKHSTTIVSR